jgi:hypothetical protein
MLNEASGRSNDQFLGTGIITHIGLQTTNARSNGWRLNPEAVPFLLVQPTSLAQAAVRNNSHVSVWNVMSPSPTFSIESGSSFPPTCSFSIAKHHAPEAHLRRSLYCHCCSPTVLTCASPRTMSYQVPLGKREMRRFCWFVVDHRQVLRGPDDHPTVGSGYHGRSPT